MDWNWAEIRDRFGPLVWEVAMRILNDRTDAVDCYQDDGTFEVRRIDGNVLVNQAPVRVLDGVTGNVQFTATEEFVNSGTNHQGGLRTAFSFETQTTRISNVTKDLRGWFLRTDLHLSNLGGVIDVRNEYGETHLELHDRARIDRPMRVISEGGEINLAGPRSLLETIPLYAYTLCGTLQVDGPENLGRRQFFDRQSATQLVGFRDTFEREVLHEKV